MNPEVMDMVQRFTASSKSFLKEYYNSLDMLYWELDLLYSNLNLYTLKRLGTNKDTRKKEEIKDIRSRVADIYKNIRFYNECINAEKYEMRRINETYCDNNYNSDDYNSSYDYRFDENELAEVKEYKYNFVTDQYE